MRRERKRIFLFLCSFFLTSPTVETDAFVVFSANAKENGIASKVIGRNESVVYINNKPHEIYIYEAKDDKSTATGDQNEPPEAVVEPLATERGFHDDTLHKLYICVNCEFAEWTRDAILTILEPYPSLYQQNFQKTDVAMFFKYCKTTPVFFGMVKNTPRFIDVLLNYQKIFLSIHDTSIDTDALSSFISLDFKLNFLNGLCSSDTYVSDIVVIRLLLDALNSLQRFIYFYCKFSTRYGNKTLYGFFTNEDGTKDDTIEPFFNDIRNLNLESPHACDARQTMLLDMIARDFGNATWITSKGPVLAKDVLKKIEVSYDTSILFWYQKYVFDTIVKFLFIKARECFLTSNQCLSDNHVTYFNSMYSTFVTGNRNLPPVMIRCLSLLKEKLAKKLIIDDSEFINTIASYINSINTVRFGNATITGTNEDLIDVSDNVDGMPVSTMNEFLSNLNTNRENVTCFARLFEYFRNKSDATYFMPFSNDDEKLASFEQELIESAELANHNLPVQSVAAAAAPDKDKNDVQNEKDQQARKYDSNHSLNKDGCALFGGLYHLFVATSIELNLALEFDTVDDPSIEITNYYPRIRFTMDTVVQYILKAVHEYVYTPHLKLVYFNILPLIHTKHKTFFTKDHNEDLRRLVFVIMTVLNDYNIQYCYPPIGNFLFFNNIDFDNFGQVDLIHRNIVKSISKASTHLRSSPRYKFKPSQLEDFTEARLHPKIEKYEKVITLSWKGERKSMLHIFNNITTGLVSTYDVIALQEYSLKFCLGVLYYDLRKSNFNNVTSDIQTKTIYLITEHFKCFKLPAKRLVEFSDLLKRYVLFVAFSGTDSEQTVWKNNLHNKLVSIGVFVNEYTADQFELDEDHLRSIDDTISMLNSLAEDVKLYSGFGERVKRYENLPDDEESLLKR